MGDLEAQTTSVIYWYSSEWTSIHVPAAVVQMVQVGRSLNRNAYVNTIPMSVDVVQIIQVCQIVSWHERRWWGWRASGEPEAIWCCSYPVTPSRVSLESKLNIPEKKKNTSILMLKLKLKLTQKHSRKCWLTLMTLYSWEANPLLSPCSINVLYGSNRHKYVKGLSLAFIQDWKLSTGFSAVWA